MALNRLTCKLLIGAPKLFLVHLIVHQVHQLRKDGKTRPKKVRRLRIFVPRRGTFLSHGDNLIKCRLIGITHGDNLIKCRLIVKFSREFTQKAAPPSAPEGATIDLLASWQNYSSPLGGRRGGFSCSWCTIWCSIWAVGAPANDLQVNLLSPAGALSALFFLCHYIGTESSWFLKRIRIMRILSFGSSYMETNWNNWNNYFTNWNNIYSHSWQELFSSFSFVS